jgi:hypothetical protein
VVGAGVRLIEQEDGAEEHRARQHLVAHTAQAEHKARRKGGPLRQAQLAREEEDDEARRDEEAQGGAQPHILLHPEEEAAGHQHDGCTGPHRGGILAQHQRQGADVDEAAAAQGVRDGAGCCHAGGVPERDIGVWGRIAEDLLRPGHRRHRVAHGGRMEGVAAIAAEDLFADESTGQNGGGEDIPVHRRGHQQGDDEGKALVGIIPGLIDAAAQQRDEPVAQVAHQHRKAAEQQRAQAIEVAGDAEQRHTEKADVLIVSAGALEFFLLQPDQCFIHGQSPLRELPSHGRPRRGRRRQRWRCPPPAHPHRRRRTAERWRRPRRRPLPAGISGHGGLFPP